MRCLWRATRRLIGAAAAIGLLVPGAARAADEKKRPDPTVLEEVLDILLQDGTIDVATRERLLAKQMAQDKKQSDVAQGFAGLEWFGDLRLRYEGFRFSHDELGNDADDRYRARYRARFGFRKKVSDRVSLGMRLASGNSGSTGDLRSSNVSFGEGGNDSFSPDGIFFDQAWIDVKIQDGDAFKLGFSAGKVANPYIGRNGIDSLIFDGDVSLEGGYFTTLLRPSEPVSIYATLGAFVIDEDSIAQRTGGDDAPSKDQKLLGLQVGTTMNPSDALSFGLRASTYQFRSLDTPFIGAALSNGTSGGGNLPGAFGEDPVPAGAMGRAAQLNGRARIGELFGYTDLKASERWPVKLYGTFARNFSAQTTTFVSAGSAVRIGKEDDAYGIGFELGNPRQIALFGVAWFHVEANAVVSSITESDFFDGFTNREGFTAYVGRELVKNIDFRFTYFDGKEIEDDMFISTMGTLINPFSASLSNADRRRFQADVILKF
jgi:hypothetical protein